MRKNSLKRSARSAIKRVYMYVCLGLSRLLEGVIHVLLHGAKLDVNGNCFCPTAILRMHERAWLGQWTPQCVVLFYYTYSPSPGEAQGPAEAQRS